MSTASTSLAHAIPPLAQFRKCSNCSAKLPVTAPLKTCSRCREKSKLSRQRKKAELLKLKAQEQIPPVTAVVEPPQVVKKVKKEQKGKEKEKKTEKKKAGKSELKRDKKDAKVRDAVKQHRVKDIIEMCKGRKHASLPPPELTCVSEDDLCASVAQSPHTSTTHAFAIIPEPGIDSKKRSYIVSRKLAQTDKLSFNYKDNIHSDVQSGSGYRRVFRCTCKDNAPPQVQPAVMRQNSGDLRTWLKGAASARPAAAGMDNMSLTVVGPEAIQTPVQPCSTRISVLVEDDRSHPLNILGQRVTVKIIA